MKKMISLLLALCLLFALAACGAAAPEEENAQTPAEWSREGYFSNENGDMLSVTRMDDVADPGWYVGCMIGDVSAGCIVPEEGGVLHGDLNAWDESAEPFVVTVAEEGEDGLLLTVEGGESYHFTRMEMPEATIFVSINTDGWGNIAFAEGEEPPEIDPEYPFQTAQINLAEPAVHTIVAWPNAGNHFVKWTKNGDDFSTEPQITVLLDESADYIAVFEEDEGWQNPVMNFVGEYQCERAHAKVSCFDNGDNALIVIDWGGSVSELARWTIIGRLDTETLTISYTDCTKAIVTFDENGEEVSQEPEYEDGTGTIVFNYEENSFTWHEDQSEYGADMVFEWAPSAGE